MFFVAKKRDFHMKKYIPLFLASGITSSIGQTVLVRELMVEVNGNEIIFSIFLSIWLLLIAVGTYIFNLFTKSIINVKKLVYSLFLSLSFIVPIQFLLIRWLTGKLTVISGLLIDIPSLILLAFLVLLPSCLIIGFLFPLHTRLLASSKRAIHTVYIWEAVGMCTGGIIFFIFVSLGNNLFIMFVNSLVIIAILFIVFRKKYLGIIFVMFIILSFFWKDIFTLHYQTRYPDSKLVKTIDSYYGRFDVTEQSCQYNYYWDGVLFANSQNENLAQEMVNFVLLQHPEPKKLFVMGGILNGYLEHQLKYPSIEIDYLELEKNIIFNSHFYQTMRNDRVNFIFQDGLYYLRNTDKKYDIIFIDLPDPSSLLLNRYYTEDFFRLIKNRLRPNGVAAITVSNAANFLFPELAQLNGLIYNTLQQVFANIKVIPARKNIFLVSDSDYICNNADEIISRMQRKGVIGKWFNARLIFDRCNKIRISSFYKAIMSEKLEINKAKEPLGYLYTIQFWAKHLDVKLNKVIQYLKNNPYLIFVMVYLFLFLVSFIFTKKPVSFVIYRENFAVLSVSFVSFVVQLILIFLFQIYYGYIYYYISIFIISFMMGLPLGFSFYHKWKISLDWLWLIFFGLLILIFIFSIKCITPLIYFPLNFLIAIIEGAILGKLLKIKYDREKLSASVSFYFLDTIGAALGGFIIGMIFIPIYGIDKSLIFIGILVLMNLVLRRRLGN